MLGEYEPLTSTCRLRRPRSRPYLWVGLVCALAGTARCEADLVLTILHRLPSLKVMASATRSPMTARIQRRLALLPAALLLQTQRLHVHQPGRWISTTTPTFYPMTRHEGLDGAVIAVSGVSPAHGYPASSNYTRPDLGARLDQTHARPVPD